MVRRRRAARALLVLVTSSTVAFVGCSRDDTADTTTTTRPTTTTTPPTTSTPDAASSRPLPVAWVRQVGGAGDDVLSAVAGRDDSVLGVGTTTGLDPEHPASPGPTAAFVDVVAAADGTPTATVQSSQPHTSAALGVGSGSVTSGDATDSPGATATTTTLSCGIAGDPAAVGTRPAGIDAWCAPVGADGVLGTAQPIGSDLDDAINAVAVHSGAVPAGSRSSDLTAFAVGRATGLFPSAKDPTGGYLGDGDALVTRLDATGAVSWARQFGTTAADDAAAVTTSDDGDAIVAGSTEGRTDGDVGGILGQRDAWIARMDPSGNLRWLTQAGTPGRDSALAVGSGGDPRRGDEVFVTAGTTDGATGTAANLGGNDAFVSAFDASGRQLWSLQLGSPGDDRATGVVVDGSTVYVSGTAAGELVGGERISLLPEASDGAAEDGATTTTTEPSSTTTPAGGGLDGFIAAIDAQTGELRWVAQFGSTGDEQVSGMTLTESGLVVVSGSTTGQLAATAPGGGTDGFLVAFVPPSSGGGAASMV